MTGQQFIQDIIHHTFECGEVILQTIGMKQFNLHNSTRDQWLILKTIYARNLRV